MAALTSPAVSACRELTAVGIGLVTVRALRVGDRRFEVTRLMAVQAANLLMFAQQREFGPGVIKGRDECRLGP